MNPKVKQALERKCQFCGSSPGQPHKKGANCWEKHDAEEMKKDIFQCSDCGRTVTRYDVSEFANNLPDRTCQPCMSDLMNNRWEGGNIEDNLSEYRCGPPKNPNDEKQQLMWEMFGDERLKNGITTRKGSSKLNIEFVKELRKRNHAKNN